MSFFVRTFAAVFAVLSASATVARAHEDVAPAPSAYAPPGVNDVVDSPAPALPPEMMNVGITEHLMGQVPLDTSFQDENGKVVHLRDFVDGKRPTLLILAYHTCPVLCGLVQNSALEAMKNIGWTAGREYQVVTLSIDPRDTISVAAEKRNSMLANYGRPEAKDGWHFLVGSEENIHKVSNAIGWNYAFDARQGQFAHPSAITVLTPAGKVARYLYGIDFQPTDLRMGLLEAAAGRSINTVDRILLYCYHYDPQERKYSLMATRVMQLAGVATIALLGSFLGVMWVRERRRSKAIKNHEEKLPRLDEAEQV